MIPAAPSANELEPRFAALAYGFESGAFNLPRNGRALFLGARRACVLQLPRLNWLCEQSFKPHADALQESGFPVGSPEPGETFALVLVLPPRQRDEARATLARALLHCAPGGTVAAAMANAEGARTGETDLRRLAGASLRSLSKHKCRVFWAERREVDMDAALLSQWLALDAVRPIDDGRYMSRPGLFAWNRIDAASALLASHLPDTLSGRVADLGAGYGYLAAHVVEHCPNVTTIDLYEADARALEPAHLNLARTAREISVGVHWHDVTSGLPHRYDAIVSNPPFHLGRADQPELGRAFIRTAAQALLPHGEFWLVANRHLPYEATLNEVFSKSQIITEDAGFKVICAREPRL